MDLDNLPGFVLDRKEYKQAVFDPKTLELLNDTSLVIAKDKFKQRKRLSKLEKFN